MNSLVLGLVREIGVISSCHDGFDPKSGECSFWSICSLFEVRFKVGHQLIKGLELVYIIFLQKYKDNCSYYLGILVVCFSDSVSPLFYHYIEYLFLLITISLLSCDYLMRFEADFIVYMLCFDEIFMFMSHFF